MDTQPPNEKKAESDNGCLAPILYWGALLAIFGISKLIAENDEPLARQIFIVGIVIWFLWPLLISLIGKNLKETKDNIVGFTYLAGMVVAGIFVLGVISLILPSSCTSNNGPAPADIYYRR